MPTSSCTEDDCRNARATAAACAAKREAGKPAVTDTKFCAYLKATQESCYCDKCACEGWTFDTGPDSTWTDEEKNGLQLNNDAYNDNGCIDSQKMEFPCGGCAASGTGHLRSSIPFLFMAAALAAVVGRI